ncbi:MAG: TolC family protein [Woeseiaceae bacterium]|nr:TolC family protein [Woeseiaceae bacterium]
MHATFGRSPDSKISSHHRRLALLSAFACLLVLATPFAAADPRIPLTIAAAEDLALRDEPGLLELYSRADALRDRAVAAGELPDPMLRVGVANYPIEGGDFSTEGMTQAQLGYRQVFPRRAVRESKAGRLEHLAADSHASAEARERAVLLATRESWLESYYWQQAIAVLTESRPLFEDLVSVTRSLYSVGRKSQFDVLQAELELQRLDDRLIAASRSLSASRARLAQWLGDDASRPVASALPDWPRSLELQSLQNGLMNHPLLDAASARVDAQQSAVDLAEASKKAGWALDLGYGYREGSLPSGEPRSDFVSVAVTFDLPFFQADRQDRELAAALAEHTAARESKRKLLAELSSQLLAQHASWTDLSRRIDLYEADILNMSAASADAALLAYQSDAGDFADVLRSAVSNLNTRLDYIRLQVEHAKSYAALANLGGLPR